MTSAIIGDLYTPTDETGVRSRLHPITEPDAVIAPNGKTLTQILEEDIVGTGIIINEQKPTSKGVWFKIQSVQNIDD